MPNDRPALVDKSFSRIDSRQTIMDFKLQTIITRDNVEIMVRPMVIYEFCDAMKVAYEVYDLSQAIKMLVQTTLRSIIGDMGLDDTLASREEINRGILQKISLICFNWGVRILRGRI
jgi:regulator of protease activity HflC (stomatin/prohibitin superfamily)